MHVSLGRLSAMGLALGLVACVEEDGDDGDLDSEVTIETDLSDTEIDVADTDTDDGTCGMTVVPVLPTDRATGVYHRTPFVVAFSADERTSATFSLRDAADEEVALGAATWSSNGKQARFGAVEPLAPSAAYTLDVTTSCGGEPTRISFTTSDTGTALGHTGFLGSTYAFDLTSATFVEPAGVNQLFASLFGEVLQDIALRPTEVTGDRLAMFGGLVEDGDQDTCLPTFDFPEGASWADPYFSISGQGGITLTSPELTLDLKSVRLSGSFDPDASAIEGLVLEGVLDTRQLLGVLGDTLGGDTGDDAVCNLLLTFTNNAVQCEPCPGGGGTYCLTILAADIEAPVLSSGIVEVTCADIDADVSCPDGCP